MDDKDSPPAPQHSDPPKEPKELLSKAIPMKWVLGAIILYMVIYNFILFINSRP